MTTRAERVARNQMIFRAGNEAVARAASGERETLPFMCECADPECLARVEVDRETYESVRAHPRRFLVVTEHASSGPETTQVVERGERFSVIEKREEAGRLAAETDPRGAESTA